NWRVASNIANLMQANPMIGQTPATRILVTDRPAYAPHFSNTNKVSFPILVTAKTLLRYGQETRAALRISAAILFKIAKIVFMEDHPVVLESQATFQFGIGGHFLLIDFTV